MQVKRRKAMRPWLRWNAVSRSVVGTGMRFFLFCCFAFLFPLAGRHLLCGTAPCSNTIAFSLAAMVALSGELFLWFHQGRRDSSSGADWFHVANLVISPMLIGFLFVGRTTSCVLWWVLVMSAFIGFGLGLVLVGLMRVGQQSQVGLRQAVPISTLLIVGLGIATVVKYVYSASVSDAPPLLVLELIGR